MLNRLRCIVKLNYHAKICLEGAESQACVQQTRWRKRRWAPVMMEKKLNPVDKIRLPEDQRLFLSDHYSKYKSQMRSIRIMWREECKDQQQEEEKKSQSEDLAKAQYDILALNEKWNADTAKRRLARMEQEAEEAEEERLQTIIQMEEDAKTFEEQARQMVLEEKEAAASFIDIDNLEEEIERALNVRVNYNFAIDTSGSKYIELEDGSIVSESEEANIVDSNENKQALKS